MCEKSFAQKQNLTNHKRIHTGKRSYECDIYKKTFTEKGSLARHKMIHTGDMHVMYVKRYSDLDLT